MMTPSTDERSREESENKLRSSIPHSSAVCSRMVLRRHRPAKRSPWKAPMVTLVLPTSSARSMLDYPPLWACLLGCRGAFAGRSLSGRALDAAQKLGCRLKARPHHSQLDDAAAFDAVAARKRERDGFAINAVLLFENALRQRLRCVVIQNRNHRLLQNRPGIHSLVHQVHGAAGELHSVADSLMLGVQAGESRQERRMNVQDSSRKLPNKMPAQDAHVAGQADQVYPRGAKLRDELAVVNFAVKTLRGQPERGKTALAGQA